MDDEIKDGFTPIIDSLVREHGLITAIVFGAVWRYCQMRDKQCSASLEVMAKRLGMNRATVMRHIKILCDNGYLVDLTPGRRNAPHIYIDTSKVVMPKPENQALESETMRGRTVAHSNSLQDRTVAMRNSLGGDNEQTVAQSNATVADSNATVAESHLKKPIKIPSKKEITTTSETPNNIAAEKLQSFYLAHKKGHAVASAADAINDILQTFKPDDVIYAVEQAILHNKDNLAYIAGICRRRASGQADTPPDRSSSNGHSKSDPNRIKALERDGRDLASKPAFDPYTGEIRMPGVS